MKQFISTILFFVFLFGQASTTNRPNPCEDPLLNLAENKGIKAIPIKDIPRFRKLMKACEDDGGGKIIEQIIYKDWQRDYNKAKTMASFTPTFSILVFLVMIYYFIGLAIATK
tara:strand:+ start:594 stop:932 length:339 start_codon:yes stop_codon:yes gene_type:complete